MNGGGEEILRYEKFEGYGKIAKTPVGDRPYKQYFACSAPGTTLYWVDEQSEKENAAESTVEVGRMDVDPFFKVL